MTQRSTDRPAVELALGETEVDAVAWADSYVRWLLELEGLAMRPVDPLRQQTPDAA